MKKIALYALSGFILLISCSKDSDLTSSNSDTNLKAGNLLTTGASARDLLSNDNFDSLLIEIAYVAGFEPTFEAISNFKEFLLTRTYKENVEFKFTSLSSPSEETLTLEEIVDLEEENRTQYNDGNTLAVYIYFADAPTESDQGDENLVTLGAVYRNTSMVIYQSTVEEIANRSATVSIADVETVPDQSVFREQFINGIGKRTRRCRSAKPLQCGWLLNACRTSIWSVSFKADGKKCLEGSSFYS